MQGTPIVALVGLEPALEAMLSGSLAKRGYRPTACAGLAEAAAAFGATPPDLFVGGLEAPYLEGWRLCRRLRSAEYPAFDRTPMLLVSTTVAGEEAARATLEAGGDELLAAPIEETRLIEAIRRLPPRGHSALAAHPGVAIALEQRQTLAALRKSQESYRLIADFTYDWEFWVGPDRMPLYHSPACERITGYTAAEFMADPQLWEKIIHPDDAAAWERHMRDDGPPGAIEFRAIAKSGAEVIIDHACQPVYGDDGEFLGRRGSNRDITGRKRAEGEHARLAERLQQSQKLESVGRLAGGVAHTLDDLLSVIGGYSALMLAGLDRRDPLHASLAAIRRSGERAAGLTRQLLAFSGEKAVQFNPLDLNGLIAESRHTLEHLLGADIELVTDLEPALGFVLADREQLQQAILNLAANARDAMPNGGRLTVKTANLELPSDFAATHPGVEAGTYAVLGVADTGAGMDAETLRRVFEPFFTTKAEGSAAGLGLAAVYGIVRQCGGWVTAESELGRGAKFTIGLPRVLATLAGGPSPLLPRAHCEPRKRFS